MKKIEKWETVEIPEGVGETIGDLMDFILSLPNSPKPKKPKSAEGKMSEND